jgi:hypothetical protein
MTRILQFTDLHLRHALPGHSGHVERLSRHATVLLQAMKARIEQEAPDLVAFTGDIIDAPHDLFDSNVEGAWRDRMIDGVRQDYRLVRDWLDGLGLPWMITPGNHDYQPVFLEVFGDVANIRDFGDVRVVSYCDWEVRDNVSERLGEQRARFEAAIDNAGNHSWTVHLQHFLIWPEVHHGYPMRYRQADELHARLVNAPGRHLVLSGHFHDGTDVVELGSCRYAVCRSTTEAPHHYRVFDLTPEGCTLTKQTLGVAPLGDRRLLAIDRSDIARLTHDAGEAKLLLEPQATATLAKAIAAGFDPVIVSAWNEGPLVNETWRSLLGIHDRLFAELQDLGAPQGAGLIIAIDEDQKQPAKLPFEALPRYREVAAVLAARYGASPANIRFMSSDISRRERFGSDRTITTIAELEKEGVPA